MTHTPPTLFSISVLLISFFFFFLFFLSSVRTVRVRDMMHMAILSASPADTMFQPRATLHDGHGFWA